MKPLVNYCRWHKAKLRLRGRDERSVWGQLLFREGGDSEEVINFRFLLQNSELILHRADGAQHLALDDMGIPLANDS